MSVRLFVGYFVALAACATAAFASIDIDGPGTPAGLAAEQAAPLPPQLDSPFRMRSHRMPLKHVQLALMN